MTATISIQTHLYYYVGRDKIDIFKNYRLQPQNVLTDINSRAILNVVLVIATYFSGGIKIVDCIFKRIYVSNGRDKA